MKRYRCEPWNKLEEDPNGEWVRYEDAQAEIGAAFQMGVVEWQGEALEVQAIECNCNEHTGLNIETTDDVFNFNPPDVTCWICPAHGYKRR